MDQVSTKELTRKLSGEADFRVLLMVLFHLSGDRRWLSPTYTPKRDVRLIADEDAGLSAAAREEIVAAAVELLANPQQPAAITNPDDALLQEMMSFCQGEPVPQEYAPMMAEQMGFRSLTDDIPRLSEQQRDSMLPVIIVGAGVSGIAMGKVLADLGIHHQIIEQSEELGGTWWDNVYPGCGVDTPNHAYSFSFGTPYRWSSYFSPREDIEDYLQGIAVETGVRENIRFNTRVDSGRWDAQQQCWHLSINNGEEEICAAALVSAIGPLSLPSTPAIDGAEDFTGPSFHSFNWPQELEIAGKHVALIGTGASSMQIAPAIADTAASVSIYQRTPQWARPIPRFHDAIGEDGQWLLENIPFYAAWYRFTMLWRYGDGLLPFLKRDPNWPHSQRSINRVNDRHRQEMEDHMNHILADRPDLQEKCLPDYPPYAKRILLDNGWYDTLLKPGIELISDAIDHLDSSGVTTASGEHRAADVIVYATGFQVATGAARLNLTGLNGADLADQWSPDDPTAHLGVTVANFPNLYCMQGPNTGLGHGGSAIFQAECQAHYIASTLSLAVSEGPGWLDVKQSVQDEYMASVDAEHATMIWTHPGVSTYYRNASGIVVSVMPWRLVDYWQMTRQAQREDFA
jgi:4-hydroxyacetophenone monooxygenase